MKNHHVARYEIIARLSEEMSIDEQQQILSQHDQGFWCIDPLDGTSNFAAGIPFFAVSVALIVAGKPQLGIVYDPIRQECFSAIAGAGAFLNGECLTMKTSPDSLKRAIGLIDFKRLDKGLATRLISQPPYASQRSFGSVALDWCWLAAGRCHVYLHGKQNIWDYAAGCLVLAEAGGQALSLEGTPVFQCSLTPRSVMAALDSRMFAEWRQWLLVTRADS